MTARKKTVRKRTRKRAVKAKPRAKRRASKAKPARARRSKPRANSARKRTGALARAPHARRVGSSHAQRNEERSGASRAAQAANAPPAHEATPATPPRALAASLAVLASQPVRAGVVRHAFARAGAALVMLEEPLAVGDRIHVRGATSDFLAEVASLRVGGSEVARAEAGEVSLALPTRARAGDIVYALRAPA
jgi:hypothetical protein